MKIVGYHNPVVQEDLKNISNSSIVDWNRFRNKTILITGGYGMLASYLVFLFCYLRKELGIDLHVIITGRNPNKAILRFGTLLDDGFLSFVKMSAEEPFGDSFPRSDFIIHAASPASGQYYDINPVGVFTTNVIGAKQTLDYAKKCGSERYLLVSSGEVYGAIDRESLKEDYFGFLDPLSVRSCYGEGKRGAECLLACYGRQYGVKGSAVRPSHTYGPTMDIENDQRVFANFVSNVINNTDIVLKSDGLALRSFCYIADATLAYIKVLLDGESSTAYNVACEAGTMSIRELAEALAEYYGIKTVFASRKTTYLENNFKRQPQMDVSRLNNLGITCSTLPLEGFKRTIRAFSLNK